LISIETYWQPIYLEVSTLKDATWALGIISFLGFFMSATGNAVSEKLLTKFNLGHWNVYGIGRLALSLFLVILSLQFHGRGFVLAYALLYLLSGIGNVAENTLINRYTPNHVRASILSLSSFLFQLGVLSASLVSSLLAANVSIRGIWALSGYFCVISFFVLFIVAFKRNKKIINTITS
jgi:predicted MFS family arabinose efflux permease